MRPIRTFDFIVVLKHKSNKLIDIISLLMLVIAEVFFTYNLTLLLVNKSENNNSKAILLSIWIIGILLWVVYVEKSKKRGVKLNYRFALLLAAWGWFMNNGTMFLSFVYIVAALIETPLKVAPEYAFDEQEIVSNSFPQKKWKWSDVSNVVLKFGMLTIDFKNNKLIQGEVNDEVSKEVENEFNEFCKKQLSISKFG